MNLWDIILLGIIALGVVFALRHLRRQRKSGCTGCCASCGMNCGRAGKMGA